MFRTLKIRMTVIFAPLLMLGLFQNCSEAKFTKAEAGEVTSDKGVKIQLHSSTVLEGDPATLNVDLLSGDLSSDYEYLWLKDGQPLTGQSGDRLSIAEATLEDNGSYLVQLSSNAKVLAEAQAFLTVMPKVQETTPTASTPGKNSLRLTRSKSTHLMRTPSSDGNGRTWTFSAWVRRASLSSGNSDSVKSVILSTSTANRFMIFFDSGETDRNRLRFHGDQTKMDFKTKERFTDLTAWLHIVLEIDTTQTTAAERVKLYINGNQVTEFAKATYPPQNYNLGVNQGINHCIGCRINTGASWFFDGYLSEVHIVDGQALDSSHFGEIHTASGKWIPKAYAGSHGSKGFHLGFNTENGKIPFGVDSSGNGNNFEGFNLMPIDAIAAGPGTGF